MSLLDEIILLPPPLNVIESLSRKASWDLSPNSDFAGNRQSSTSSIRLTPWVLGSSTPDMVGDRWADLCRCAKARNLWVDCSAGDLEGIPLNSLPRRIFRQFIEQPFSADEFSSADVIEVVLYSRLRGNWGLPPEVGQVSVLPDLVDAVRSASGGSSKIAVSIDVGQEASVVESIIAARPDMLSLDATDSMRDELMVATLAQVRTFPLRPPPHGQPILLRTHHGEPENLVKLLALGASAVTVDGVLGDVWSAHQEMPSGFLSTVQTSIHDKTECPIEKRLRTLDRTLEKVLDLTCDSPLAHLGGRLRATTERAARIAKIPLLEYQGVGAPLMNANEHL